MGRLECLEHVQRPVRTRHSVTCSHVRECSALCGRKPRDTRVRRWKLCGYDITHTSYPASYVRNMLDALHGALCCKQGPKKQNKKKHHKLQVSNMMASMTQLITAMKLHVLNALTYMNTRTALKKIVLNRFL